MRQLQPVMGHGVAPRHPDTYLVLDVTQDALQGAYACGARQHAQLGLPLLALSIDGVDHMGGELPRRGKALRVWKMHAVDVERWSKWDCRQEEGTEPRRSMIS